MHAHKCTPYGTRFLLLIGALLLLMTACQKTPPRGIDGPAAGQEIALNDISVISFEDSPHTFESRIFTDIDTYPERKAMMPNGEFKALTKTYLIRPGGEGGAGGVGGKNILVDSGLGTESGVAGKTQELLMAHGVAPADVTDILLTHMDIDHISGLVHQGQAVYPKAILRLSRPEYEAWVLRGADRKAEHIALSRKVADLYAGRIVLFSYGETVLPGIVAEDLHGHTGGHTGYTISSGDKSLTIVGDFLHVAPIQLRYPDYSSVYDAQAVVAAASRKRMLDQLSTGNSRIAGMHFPDIGKVRRMPQGYSIVPE